MSYTLGIYKCPQHGFMCISVDDEELGCGTRLTPSKCCGRWGLVKKWAMNERALSEAARVFQDAADDTGDATNREAALEGK